MLSSKNSKTVKIGFWKPEIAVPEVQIVEKVFFAISSFDYADPINFERNFDKVRLRILKKFILQKL